MIETVVLSLKDNIDVGLVDMNSGNIEERLGRMGKGYQNITS